MRDSLSLYVNFHSRWNPFRGGAAHLTRSKQIFEDNYTTILQELQQVLQNIDKI